MAWIPKYIIEGGMYGGRMCPAGSLTNLVEISPNKNVAGSNLRSWGERRSSNQDYVKWTGPYGMTDDLIRDYLESHDDGQIHNFDLIEIFVENPEGAQFYRQSIVFTVAVTAHEVVMPKRTPEESDLHLLYYEITTYEISRREYPTPYSPYTSTPLSAGSIGINGYYYLQGTIEIGGAIYSVTDNLLLALGEATYQNKKYFGLALYNEISRCDGFDTGWSNGSSLITLERLDEVFIKFVPDEKDDPNEEDDGDEQPGPGHGGSGGGEGEHVLPDFPIPIPPNPTIGPASVSWLTTYMMSVTDISEFGEELVNPDAIQMLKQMFNDPLDAIVGITMCPCIAGPRYSKTPMIHGAHPYTWSRSFMAILNQYSTVDCGIVRIDPYWDSCFDFDPYTRFTFFLPFIGYRDINADEIMGTNVHIIYKIDVCTGDCTAFIAKAAPSESIYGPMPEQVIAEFSGNCGVQVPIGRVDRSAQMQAAFTALAAGVGLAVGGAASGAGLVEAGRDMTAAQLTNQVSHSTMTGVNGMKTKVERSGSLAGNAGYMGNRKPYIIRKLARQSLPDNYKEIMGYPCNKPGPLRNYVGTGLAAVEDIQLNNIPAFGDELEEIISLLKGGVLV